MSKVRFKYAEKFVVALSAFISMALPATEAAVDKVPPAPTIDTGTTSRFYSADDGWFDVSAFLDEMYGFIPVVIPITEPAVGYGAAAVLAFIDKPKGETRAGFGRPNMTVVGGMRTENGTRGAVVGDVRHWLEDRLQTVAGVIDASVNLDYHGVGRDEVLNDHPLRYNLDTRGGMVQAKYRLGDSFNWAGIAYAHANTIVGFDAPPTTPGIPDIKRTSRVGGLTPSFTYDSRDNIFTPIQGTYLEATVGLFSKGLGGDANFQRANLVGMHYLPLRPDLSLGLRGSGSFSFGDAPFYLRPFVMMRGVAAMRYQGEHVTQVEAEARWQFWQRFSMVGFAGIGSAWNGGAKFNQQQRVSSGGVGFRYEVARKHGIHMGLDLAAGPDGRAIYVQFGSAWMRP